MNIELFILKRITASGQKSHSGFFLRIAAAAVAVSVATMIVASSLINGFQSEIRNKVFGFWAHIQVLPYSLSRSYQEEGIYRYRPWVGEDLPDGFRHLQVTALKGGLLRGKNTFEGVVLKGVGDDFDWDNLSKYLTRGEVLKIDTSSVSKGIIISEATCKRLNIDTGSKVIVNFIGNEIRSRAFKVTGVFNTGVEEFDKRYALVDIGVIQQLNGWGKDTVGGFELFLHQDQLFSNPVNEWKSKWSSFFGGNEELVKKPLDQAVDKLYDRMQGDNLDVQTVQNLHPGIFDWLELQSMNEWIILILMMVVAVMNMITALLILILDRTAMIGIMKAMGSKNRSLQKIFVYYGVFITGWGLLIGNFIGISLCLLQYHFQWIKLPQESYYLSYAPIDLNWYWVGGINVLCLITCFAALQLPALMIRRISPVKAIRFD